MTDESTTQTDAMQVFKSPEFWSGILSHCITRRVSVGALTKWCEAEYRNDVIKQIENGTYKIAPPYIGYVPKPDGGTREVFINTDQDRIILNGVYTIYNQQFQYLIHPSCVSYARGLGVNKISKQVQNEVRSARAKYGSSLIGCKLDIRKYFDRVPIDVIEHWLAKLQLTPALDRLLSEYYHDNTIRTSSDCEELTPHYKSLAQGCAMSALLANLALSYLDAEMSKVCQVYYRYSDDVLFFTTDILQASEILSRNLTAVGLEIHPEKMEMISQEFEFLGVNFTNKGRGIGSRGRSVWKQEIHSLTTATAKTRGNKDAVRKTIGQIQRRFLVPVTNTETAGKQFCWAAYFFSIVDNDADIHWADNIVKDSLRHMYTGKWNFTHNRNKLSNEQLRELGWVSLVQLYKAYRLSADVYAAEIGRMQYARTIKQHDPRIDPNRDSGF